MIFTLHIVKLMLIPKLPKFVGGDIDFMIGIRYNRHQPKLIFELPSGLAIYRSVFENADGRVGVVGGPHQIFSIIESHSKFFTI